MWNVLWWIAIAALFVWMMSRGGCGMVMGRWSHADRHAGRPPSGRPIDPVCGMELDPEKAAGTRVATGETYFLCSQTCVDAFDRNPAMYAHREPTHRHHHAGC